MIRWQNLPGRAWGSARMPALSDDCPGKLRLGMGRVWWDRWPRWPLEVREIPGRSGWGSHGWNVCFYQYDRDHRDESESPIREDWRWDRYRVSAEGQWNWK